MSTTVPTPPVAGAPAPIPTPPPAPAAPLAPTPPAEPPADDWQAKFEAQQKVNRDLEAKLKAAIPKDEAETIRAELAKLQGKEAEYAAAQEAARVQSEAVSKANERVVRRAVREHAATRLSDPADALLYLDLAKFQVDENGDVDDAAITAAVESLVKSKPYLAAQGGAGPVFTSPTSSREGDAVKPQLTREQLKDMTPDQIVTAKAEGRLNTVLGIKS